MTETKPTPAFCTSCGTKTVDDAKFCAGCGSPLRADATGPSTRSTPAVGTTEPAADPRVVEAADAHPDWWRRLAAFLVDQVLIFAATAFAMQLVLRLVGAVAGFDGQERFADMFSDWISASLVSLGGLFGVALVAGTYWYYDVTLDSEHRATLGQRLLRFRVRDVADGGAIDGRQRLHYVLAMLMYAVPLIGWVAGPVAAIMFFVRPDRRLPHDLLGGVIATAAGPEL